MSQIDQQRCFLENISRSQTATLAYGNSGWEIMEVDWMITMNVQTVIGTSQRSALSLQPARQHTRLHSGGSERVYERASQLHAPVLPHAKTTLKQHSLVNRKAAYPLVISSSSPASADSLTSFYMSFTGRQGNELVTFIPSRAKDS